MFKKWGEALLKNLGEPQAFYRGSDFEAMCAQWMQYHPLQDLFPYESYDAEHQLFLNGQSVGFVLETPPLVGASEEMQKEVSGLFQHVLPEESSLQVMLFADPHIGSFLNQWQALRQDERFQSLSQKRVDYLNRFAWNSPHPPYGLRQFRCFWSFSKQTKSMNPTVLGSLTQIKAQIKTSLELLGLSVQVWEAEDLINTLTALFNLHPDKTEPDLKRWDERALLSTQIGEPDNHLTVEANGLGIHRGFIKMRSYQVTDPPPVWSLHAMGQLIGDEDRDVAQIPCPFLLHYGLSIPKQGLPRTRVLTKARYVERQAELPIGRYMPSIQQEAEELAFVRTQLAKGERVVQSAFNLILFAKESELIKAEQIAFNLYRSREWRLKANQFFHLPIFLSCLPMMWGQDRVQSLLHHRKLKTTLSTESANLLPIQGEWQGTHTPGMLLGGRRGQIMTWYPFDNKAGNYNVCVVGRSGSGKSVFMQELMTTTLGLGGRVFVLDVGRSFEKTCFLLEGQFIEFKTKTPLCLNPFSSIPVDDLESAQDALAMLKSVLALMAAPTQGLDDMEIALLEQAMLAVWQAHQQASTITLIAECLLKNKAPKARDLGTMLFPYTAKGIYGCFFEGKSDVDLRNPLVVLELEELKERKDLQSVVVQIMIINITNRMFLGDRKTPFQIFFDEAWDLLRGTQSGIFIETLARRLRKYYGSLVVGTQSINDLFVNPAAQAAFDNSDWMCLLSQKKESIEQLKKLGRIALTPAMEAQLKSVKTKQGEYAEVMIYGSNGFAVGRLLLDPYSTLLYSTQPRDYAAVKQCMAQGLSVSRALEQCLKQKEEVS